VLSETVTKKNGRRLTRLRFNSFAALERFYVNQIAATDVMQGCEYQIIGTTILIWDKKETKK